jgi:hypothetical protein
MSSYTSRISFLILLLSLAFSLSLSAEDKKKKEAVKIIPLYQGINIGLELGKPIQGMLSNSYGASVKADVNLKNKYFPTLELGYSNYDKSSDLGIRCLASGQYFKIGVNKALTYKGDKAENLFFVGAHYGFSAFSYSLKSLSWYENYWGDNTTVTSFDDEKSVVGWVELVAGVRVKIFGPFSLGWTGQYKSTLHVSNGNNSNPAYIPGYGEYLKPLAGLSIYLYYKLPF